MTTTKRHYKHFGDVISQGLASCGPGKAQAASGGGVQPEGRRRKHDTAGRFASVRQSDIEALGKLSGASAILVWLALRLHANRAGECWPSNARLCAVTGLSRRVVQLAKAELVRVGLLKSASKDGRICVYYLSLGGDPQITGGAICGSPGGRSTDHGGAICGSPPLKPRGRSGDHPNKEERREERGERAQSQSARPPSGEEKSGHPEGGLNGAYLPYVAEVVPQSTKEQATGARRLARAVATLELLRVPVASLSLLDAEYLSTLSAADYTKALREAEKNRSTLPLTGPAPFGKKEGGG